jgi:glycosyltransferase involved in cell wall biosynthesis
MSISGCMLVKNEADIIANSLKCLSKFTDEIIVVDNGSTDSSVEIAKSFNCKIIYSPDTILDDGRNKYLDYVSSDWIFVLDADEEIAENYYITIKNFCNSARQKDIVLARLPRYEYLGNGSFSEILVSRLFKNKVDIRYDGCPIHSAISPSIRKFGGKDIYLHVPIHHLDSLIGKNDLCKRERYIQLLKDEIAKNNLNYLGFLHLFLGVEYATLGNYDEALQLFAQAIKENKVATDLAILYTIQVYNIQMKYDDAYKILKKYSYKNSQFFDRISCVLAQIAYKTDYYDKAVSICKEGIKIKPSSVSLYLNLAFLFRENYPDLAINNIVKALKLNDFLLDKRFYLSVENKYSNFLFQNCLIAKRFNIYDCLIEAYTKMNDIENKSKWENMKHSQWMK